jgi:hypothetical protein
MLRVQCFAFNACGVQRVQLPVAFNAARSMLRVQCLGRSLLRVQLPAAFNAARSIATRLIACGVQCCAFNCFRVQLPAAFKGFLTI